MQERKIEILVRIFSYNELPTQYQLLITEAKKQCKQAYAPYSKFQVGAAVLLENQTIIGGNNQENAAYPSGLCAERVAIFAANAQYPQEAVKAIAIAADKDNAFTINPITPCGSCRQVILETENRFNQDIEFLLYGEKEILLIKGTTNLLPLAFKL